MSGRSGGVNSGVVKTVGFCVLSFSLATVAGGVSPAASASGQPPPQTSVSTSSAATLALLHIRSLYMPSAGGSVRDAPFEPRKPNLTPMPAPAATNHYAGFLEIRIPYLDDKHPATRRMPESILAVQEEHAGELADFPQDMPSGLRAKARAAVK